MSEVIKQWDDTSDETHETSVKKFDDDTYTPLYQGLTIDKSKVHGLGLSLIHI